MQVDLIHESISAKETILFALLSRAEVHNLVRSDLESEDGDVSGLNRRRYCDRRFAEVVVAVVEADVMDDAQLRFLFFRGVLLNEGDVMLLRLSVVEDVVLADSAAVANDGCCECLRGDLFLRRFVRRGVVLTECCRECCREFCTEEEAKD
mmetsp:Transcript_36253/g.53096  ORF Transcript_36253/g.53096 Transcript_36253/m.53096 type:complete len:151 (-) Transcript_36253:437-889(-)